MGYLKYNGYDSPVHECKKPHAEHLGDIWQCEDCLKCFIVVDSALIRNGYRIYGWNPIPYSEALTLSYDNKRGSKR